MSTPTAPSPLHAVSDRIEALDALDAPARRIGKTARGAVQPGPAKDAISGTWLGHAVHPVLTDLVIGSFTSASLLDVFGGPDSDTAARRLIEVGLAVTPVTALTGLSDWADAEPVSDGVRRVGLVHAASNFAAATLYTASLLARRRGRRGAGAALALAGAGVMTASGWLGGHLSYQQGVGTDQTRFDAGPTEWTAVIDDAGALRESEPHRALAGDTPVLLVRRAGRILAIHDRCSHRGCSLSDGEVADSMVTCSCHGSRFSLEDGLVLRGPATSDQPAFDVREQDGRVEVRLRPR